jgi:hypothetical protein
VLRRITGPKWEEVVGDWRRQNNEELHSLYTSSIIIRMIKAWRMRWVVHAACMREMRNVHKIFIRRPERERPLGRPRHRWQDSIRMGLKEIG